MNRNRIATIGRQRGFSIMEAVIGIAVFFIGMLALAALQGSLTRSMTDAKTRSQAAVIAEQTIEGLRGFTSLAATTGVFDYTDIVDGTSSEVVNGVTYTVATDVTDFWYDIASETFTTTTNGGTSAYKQVEVVVGWDAAQNLRTVEGTEIAASTLAPGDVTIGTDGSGNPISVTGIKVTAVIPAVVTSSSAKVAEASESEPLPVPNISYTPGLNPEVIALSLGNSKFKESLLPAPKTYRTEDQTETRFDVITYSSSGSGALFLRREEFSAVACVCTMQGPDANNPSRRPTVWAGDEYLEGHWVEKPYGVSADSQQAPNCDQCCRDHHDGGSSADDHTDPTLNKYSPWKSSTEYHSSGDLSGDHKHYLTDGVTEAGTGDNYLEVCRMTRVNGFFRAGHDFRREDKYVFPEDYLDDQNEIDYYSGYATGAVTAFEANVGDGYESSPPCIGLGGSCVAAPSMQGAWPDPIAVDGGGNPTQLPSWTQLPFGDAAAETEQLRSRGIYIDYFSDDLRAVVNCIQGGGNAASCESNEVKLDQTGSSSVLEILPFFDVQLTYLDRWNETPIDWPIDTTNQAIEDNNAHSRGVIFRQPDELGAAIVWARGHRGNQGFTDTKAIDPYYSANLTSANLIVQSLDDGGLGGGEPIGGAEPIISGTVTDTVSGSPPDVTVTGLGNVACDQLARSFQCRILSASGSNGIRFSGFGKKNTNRYVCSSLLSKTGENSSDINAWSEFSLSGAVEITIYTFNIQETPC